MLQAQDIEALAAGAARSPDALFAAIAEVARRRVDAGLVTAMRHDEAASTVERIYSSNEQAYPVGADGAESLPLQSKARIAAAILDRVETLLSRRTDQVPR